MIRPAPVPKTTCILTASLPLGSKSSSLIHRTDQGDSTSIRLVAFDGEVLGECRVKGCGFVLGHLPYEASQCGVNPFPLNGLCCALTAFF